ncbi:MAG: glycosyltransferase family A protein [Bdellovibrionota bacterium]
MKRLPLSVVVPTYRNTLRLRELLGSLERQSRRLEYEVIVVANLPEPGLKKVVESYGPRFRFLETGRIGANLARNKGVERARGDIVVFLDDDSYVSDKDFLERVHALHESHPASLAIGGPYTLRSGATACETAYHLVLEHRLRSSRRRYDETSLLLGGNWSFKAHSLGARLRFDDTIAFGGTELELFARLIREGHSLLLDDSSSVVHQLRLSVWGLARRAYAQGLAFGRLAPTAGSTRHWHSTLTVRECAENAGLAWSRRVRFFALLYRKIFEYGVSVGNERDLAPSTTLRRWLAELIVVTGNAFALAKLEAGGKTRSETARLPADL